MKVLTGVKGLLAAAVAAAGLAAFAEVGPSVTLNRVQQRYPWNGMVDIDYTVTNVPEPADYFVRFTATTKTGAKYVAHEMLDASTLINASNGTYRVTWVASAEGTVFQDCAEFFAKDAKYKAEIVYSGSDKSQIPYPFYVVIDVSGGKDATSYPVAYEYFANTHLATNKYNTAEYKTNKIVLRKIHARTFTMGAPEDEEGREPVDWGNKETQHEVTLTEDYYFGMFPLTQRQWTNVMGSNPSLFYGGAEAPARPVEQVSYDMIRGTEKGVDVSLLSKGAVDDDSFLGKLRGKSGLTDLDLPTEAQWENAARAGTTTSTFFGNNVASNMKVEEVGKYMWHNGNSLGMTHGVGQVIPNQIGLYDVLGNAWEWCLDRVTKAPDDDWGSDPVTDPLRAVADGKVAAHSGAWNEPIVNARSACRGGGNDVTMKQWGSIGFRLAMHAPVRQQPGSVQLWKDGPYFANCNIGATKSYETGYYFWWGDTVGYRWDGSKWVSVKDSTKSISFATGDPVANQTCSKTIAQLYDNGNGYIDDNSASGKLKPAYDAATVYLGAPWRMPTKEELEKLATCTRVWMTRGGVSGWLVSGTGDYSSNSAFFPLTGYGTGSSRQADTTHGFGWSSLPWSENKDSAWKFEYYSSGFSVGLAGRCLGYPVRPVKDAK